MKRNALRYDTYGGSSWLRGTGFVGGIMARRLTGGEREDNLVGTAVRAVLVGNEAYRCSRSKPFQLCVLVDRVRCMSIVEGHMPHLSHGVPA